MFFNVSRPAQLDRLTSGQLGLLAQPIQDSVGAFFGVSGAVVVVVVLFIAAAHFNDKDERQKRTSQINPISQLCTNREHNKCSGRVRVGESDEVRPCRCTCHGSISANCDSMSRLDLCGGRVQIGESVVPCRCSCHQPRD